MSSDNYSFEKSCESQSLEDNTPYKSKTFSYINDINSGVYNNNGLSMVSYDLSSIYNSTGFSDTSDMFLTIPIVLQAVYNNGDTGQVAPPADAFSRVSLKSNFAHLIHQIEVVANGKTVQDMQPYISIYKHFKMLSQMTQNDLYNNGTTLGFSDSLDSTASMRWVAGAGANAQESGSYLTNNRAEAGSIVAGGTQNIAGIQNVGCVNEALQKRIGRYIDVSNTSSTGQSNNFIGTLITKAQLNTELRPFHEIQNNVSLWYDYCVVRVKDLCDVMAQMGLTKKLDVLLRLYINTGSITVGAGGTTTTQNAYWYTSPSLSTFTNTCPITVNYTGGVHASAFTQITAGCYIARTPAQTIRGATIASYGSQMNACRCYYSVIEIDPEKARLYLESNLNKRIVYESVITNTYNAIASGTSFSQLVQSGIRAPLGVLVVPLIASASQGGTSQYASPFDSCPATFAPCLSLTNFQVTLGGVQQFQGTGSLNYAFEQFIEQISSARDTTAGTLGFSVGLINQRWWESNKVYYCDLSRGTRADKEMSRNLNISFLNNSNVAIDILVFTIFNDQIVLNVSNGAVQRL